MRGSVVLLAAFIVGSFVVRLVGQQQANQNPPAFEVATIKPNTSGDARTGAQFAGTRFSMINETLWRFIGEAYANPVALPRHLIVGGPSWLDTDRFDVDAVAAMPLDRHQADLMLRTLLSERFKLVMHTDKREMPVFALRLARRDGAFGPQLHRAEVDCAALEAAGTAPPVSPTGRPCVMQFGFGRSIANGLTIHDLATAALSRFTERPVIDETGLSGAFQWLLTWTPDNLPQRAPGAPDQPLIVNGLPIDPNGPSLFTALQEQLGLKLEPTKGPVDVLVIDHVEKPTPD